MRKQNSRRYAATSSLLAAAVLVGLVAAATALAAAPQTTSPPTLEGGPYRQGTTIRAGNGLWANNPTSFSYRWQRCDAAGIGCGNIGGATANTYRLAQADVGRTVRVLVTARNADGASTANSKPGPVVADNTAPSATAPPTISGSAAVGEELTANDGTWTGAPDRYAYQWQQCDAAGSACAAVAGATGKIYGVRSADQGRTLRVAVTAVNPKGFKLEGQADWLNFSKFAADLVPPARGQVVAVHLDKSGYVRAIAPAGDVTTTVVISTGPSRDVTITRLAVLKAASVFAASRPELRSADLIALAERMEAWVTR